MPTIKPLKTLDLIGELRQQLKLSQGSLAAKLGVLLKTVSCWENEQTASSSMVKQANCTID
ncbi:hypothetical protein Glo7428_3675 [Gloeocapsa sp. PCC 7428]|uniref:helix-turn-helix domain-containing protein n=1 Tax=Gloeocapsa sp. PCC 7428 TaxID=1173026 RepID=UPI0002A60DFC|nr:helix-turn-helix domain-containing protein [Gloeocapsa sp. PCC 7428]AFZ32141.1 hypothetical protein Glo7428_3675 [Gloeocapsa sp. PCC 7428]